MLQIRLTQGGEPAERPSGKPFAETPGSDDDNTVSDGGYLRARDGRLQKIWAPPAAWLSERYPLRILYEDQDILAADKPSGVVCHPSLGHFDDTLSNQIAEHLGCIGRELDVRVTGRLDKDTSGIVIFALNTETAAQLIKQRQASLMNKLYIARVRGHFPFSEKESAGNKQNIPKEQESGAFLSGPPGSAGEGPAGTIDLPLRRESESSFRMITAEDGKAAKTHYRILARLEDGTSLAACRIEHGRTHQIRVHMASIGHPIVGDRLYGPEAEESAGRQEGSATAVPLMLHAYRAVLRQPFTGQEIRLEAPLPPWAAFPDRSPGE